MAAQLLCSGIYPRVPLLKGVARFFFEMAPVDGEPPGSGRLAAIPTSSHAWTQLSLNKILMILNGGAVDWHGRGFAAFGGASAKVGNGSARVGGGIAEVGGRLAELGGGLAGAGGGLAKPSGGSAKAGGGIGTVGGGVATVGGGVATVGGGVATVGGGVAGVGDPDCPNGAAECSPRLRAALPWVAAEKQASALKGRRKMGCARLRCPFRARLPLPVNPG
jgi:hypothetical protein